jgi:hypothetical protein
MTSTVKTLFPLGQIVATPGALVALGEAGVDALTLICRHVTGDWGEMEQPDKDENDLSLAKGFRIFSAYDLPGTGQRIWVITESDRSATTLLLPEEY